jgi:CBS domain-containing protein
MLGEQVIMFRRSIRNNDPWHLQPAISFAQIAKDYCVEPNATLRRAYEQLENSKSLEILLITEKGKLNQKLLGIIESRQLHRVYSTENNKKGETLISEFMTPVDPSTSLYPVITSNDNTLKALKLLMNPLLQLHNNVHYLIHGLPIVDAATFKVLNLIIPSDYIHAINEGLIVVPDIPLSDAIRPYSLSQNLPVVLPDDSVNDISAFMRGTGNPTIPVIKDKESMYLLGVITESRIVDCIHSYSVDERDQIMAVDPRIMISFDNSLVISKHERLKDAVNLLTRYNRAGMLIVISDFEERKFEGFVGRTRIFQVILQHYGLN